MNKGNIIIGLVTVAVFAGLGFLAYSQSQPPATTTESGELISANGLHAHATLNIYEDGELVQIPANIGLIGGHSPIHIHDTDNVVHLEFPAAVYEEDTTLAAFFSVWGEDFSEQKILDNTTEDDGNITMTVNGTTSTAYENYQLKDGDVVEIRYTNSTSTSTN